MKQTTKNILHDLKDFLRWVVAASITGIVIGAVGVAFVKGLHIVNDFRADHPAIIFGLPIAGIFIVTSP